MTIEQQLETLKKMRNDVWEESEDYQALCYAIQAIEALEALQPTCNQLASDCISRQDFDKFLEDAEKEAVKNRKHVFASALNTFRGNLKIFPSAQPEIIHCCDCIYYDQEHIENNGVRYEYEDMPKDAFDILGTGLVNSEYGINVGGRCCRDYHVGYSEDKRVFVSKQNYCGRAERRQDE